MDCVTLPQRVPVLAFVSAPLIANKNAKRGQNDVLANKMGRKRGKMGKNGQKKGKMGKNGEKGGKMGEKMAFWRIKLA